MSGTYTSDEKVEYALKTALFRTMQSKDQPSSLEKSAPPRIFPKNIMKVNLIEKGEGDIDEDGYYVGRATASSAYNGSNDLVNLEEPELTISNYRIIDPASNKITDKRVSDLTTVTISETDHSSINALPTTGTTYPLKNWFFRGHYGSHTGTAAFNAASSGYDGLQLAWDKSTVGATATEEDIVPHLKFYLQVQTNFTNVAHGDNITYGHDLMKGLIGLDQNFSTTIQVVQGEGGSCATLGTTGASTGDFWFTQATSGTLSFYGVTNKVNASASLSNLATTKFPMISFIRYTGETGFGAGSGGGGSATVLTSADSNVSAMISGTADTMPTQTFEFDGNVGIGTDSPGAAKLHILAPNNIHGLRITGNSGNNAQIYATGSNYGIRVVTTGSSGAYYSAFFEGSTGKGLYVKDNGDVGIATTNPLCGLQVGAEGEDSLKSSMKFARFMGAGYRNNFPAGAYNGFSCDNHGTFVMGNNCHIKYNGEVTITNSHTTMAGVGVCMPGNSQSLQGSILFLTKNPTGVSAGDVAYDIDTSTPSMIVHGNGFVGIGTRSPWTGLHVEASHGGNYHQAYNSWLWEANYTHTVWTADNHRPQWSDSLSYFSLYSNRAIMIRNGGIWSASDKRIKMNIEDVPDHLALEMVRNIPCRYYEYKDPTRQNGNKKTIGFIAQEVDEIFPLAVTKKEDFIPSEMRLLIENENAIWSDLSNNTYKLYITDLEDAIPNTECIFMLSDCSGDVIEKKIEVLEDGKSFIFNKKWNKVFLHSKRVSDFHVVDKQKLFALNFSATQELDRKVITLENENAELKTKVATLESELAAIKQHLGI